MVPSSGIITVSVVMKLDFWILFEGRSCDQIFQILKLIETNQPLEIVWNVWSLRIYVLKISVSVAWHLVSHNFGSVMSFDGPGMYFWQVLWSKKCYIVGWIWNWMPICNFEETHFICIFFPSWADLNLYNWRKCHVMCSHLITLCGSLFLPFDGYQTYLLMCSTYIFWVWVIMLNISCRFAF